MTITSLPARDEYTATAGQTLFNYTFKIYFDTDLQVFVTPSGQVSDDSTDEVTGFAVTGVGNEDGGSVTLLSGANAGDLVTIVSNIPTNRTVDYQNNGDFIPTTVNNDFDRSVSLIKQSEDLINRTLVGQKSQQNANGLSLPSPESQKFLRWKNDLSGLENVVPATGPITLPIYQVSQYGSIQATLDVIGAIDATMLIDVPNVIVSGTTVTIPSNVSTQAWIGGISDGVAGGGTETLNIRGPFSPGRYQVFGSNLSVSFTGIGTIYADWWGGGFAGIKSAYDSLPQSGGRLWFPSGEIDFEGNELVILKDGVTLIGYSWTDQANSAGTYIFSSITTGTDSLIRIGDKATTTFGVFTTIIDMYISGNANRVTPVNGLNLEYSQNTELENIRFQAFDGYAIHTERCFDLNMNNVQIFTSGNVTTPAFDIASDATNRMAVAHINGMRIEQNFGTALDIASESRWVKMVNLKIENSGEGVKQLVDSGEFTEIVNGQFHLADAGVNAITMDGNNGLYYNCALTAGSNTSLGILLNNADNYSLDFSVAFAPGSGFKFQDYAIELSGTSNNNTINMNNDNGSQALVKTGSSCDRNLITVNSNGVSEVSGTMVQLAGERDAILNSVIYDPNGDAGTLAVELLGSNSKAMNNDIRNYETGIKVSPSSGTLVFARVSGNDIDGGPGGKNGIVLDGVSNANVSNNSVANYDEDSIIGVNVDRSILSNNIIRAGGRGAANTYSGINMTATGTKNGNVINNNVFQSNAAAYEYLIKLDANYLNGSIIGNAGSGAYTTGDLSVPANNLYQTATDSDPLNEF